MNTQQLIKRLQDVPLGMDVIVKGRRWPVIGVSIPEDSPIPNGWQATNEIAVQRIPGFKRVSFTVTQEG